MSSPLDVISTALAVPLPCPECGRAEVCRCIRPPGYSAHTERARLIEAALVQYGHLSAAFPDTEPSEDDVKAAAVLLCRKSRHARYDYAEGYLLLHQSPRDVEVAFAAAEKRGLTGSEAEELGRARDLLLDWHRRAPETRD